MKKRTAAALALSVIIALAGCGQTAQTEEQTDAVTPVETVSGEEATVTPEEIEPEATATPTPSPEPTATPTPELTGAAAWEGTNIVYVSEHGYKLELPESWTDRYNYEAFESGDSFYCSGVQGPGYSGLLFSILYGDGSEYADEYQVTKLPPLLDGTQFFVLYPSLKPYPSDDPEKEAEYQSMYADVEAVVSTFVDVAAAEAPENENTETTEAPEGATPTATPEGTEAAAETAEDATPTTAPEGAETAEGTTPTEATEGAAETTPAPAEEAQPAEPAGGQIQKPTQAGGNNNLVIAGVMGFTGLESEPAQNFEDGTYFYESYVISEGIQTTFVNQSVATPVTEATDEAMAKAVLDKLYQDTIRDVNVSQSSAYSAQFAYPTYYATYMSGVEEDSQYTEALLVETDGYFLIYSVSSYADFFDQELADIAMSNLYVADMRG